MGVGVLNDPDLESFRQSMRRLASTVSIITCQRAGVRYGMTVTSVASLSFSPLSLLVCLNHKASMAEPLLMEGRFCVNLLRRSQMSVSKSFSGAVPPADRFSQGSWAERDGIPYLCDAQANLFCELDGTYDYATHHIVVGRVVDSAFYSSVEPLIYQDGEYAFSSPLKLQGAA